jgi:hypothetical protein
VPKPLAVVPDLEEELDRLFALPREEFTAARNDLARRMKDAGQNAIAARIRELRKPTVPVWAANQLARQHPEEVEALIGAVDELRAAQEHALRGDESGGLREATTAERTALRALTHRAHDVLAGEGSEPAASVLERVASILRAAAVDPVGRDLLASGRLTEELEATGFTAFEGMQLPARRSRPKTRAPRRTDGAAECRQRERLRKLRERTEKLEAAAAEAEREAVRVETDAARARKKADRANAQADRARAELEAAEADADLS